MLVMLTMLAVPVAVFAQGDSGEGFGTEFTEFSGTQTGNDLADSIRTIVNTLLALVGLIAAIYLVMGGVTYITSKGDEDKAADAKNTILYAIIGLIVIGLSGVIINFILQSVR